MKIVVVVFIFFVSLIIGSCGGSNYPCPSLSTSAYEKSKGVLVKKSVAVNKNGLVRKKNVKRLKRR